MSTSFATSLAPPFGYPTVNSCPLFVDTPTGGSRLCIAPVLPTNPPEPCQVYQVVGALVRTLVTLTLPKGNMTRQPSINGEDAAPSKGGDHRRAPRGHGMHTPTWNPRGSTARVLGQEAE